MEKTPQKLRRVRFALTALVVAALTLTTASYAVEAQDDVDDLEVLKEEREVIQQELASQALQVDAATADFGNVAQALDDVNALVDLQEARLSDATQRVRSAEAVALAAQTRQQAIFDEVDVLQGEVRNLALASFTGEALLNGGDVTALLLSPNPTEAARRRSLVELQTGSLSDGVDRMRALGVEAELIAAELDAALNSAR